MAPRGSVELVGNTKTNSRPSASKSWTFTLNNYTDQECDILKNEIKKYGSNYRVQSEVGESGTPHLQGFIELTTKGRPSETFSCKRIHWEKARSDKHARKYCCKDETADNKIIWDSEPIIKLCNPYGWQLDVMDIIAQEPDDRTINWFWEPNGKYGKSALTKYLCVKKNALCVSGKSNDCKYAIISYKEEHKEFPRIVIFDVPRTNIDYINYEAIESIKNGVFFSGKYESKQVIMNSPHILIFANSPPITHKLSEDRWNIKRIDHEACGEDLLYSTQ